MTLKNLQVPRLQLLCWLLTPASIFKTSPPDHPGAQAYAYVFGIVLLTSRSWLSWPWIPFLPAFVISLGLGGTGERKESCVSSSERKTLDLELGHLEAPSHSFATDCR